MGDTHLESTPAPAPPSSATFFDCSICLDAAAEPVVTLCGHLYCWPCIHGWLRRLHRRCPVCSSPISAASLVPLYGRGSGGRPADPAIPRRPRRAAPREPAGAEHSTFGGAAVAAMGLRCADHHPYLAGSNAAAEEDEARSLRRISGFLLCCVVLCLLLF